MYGKVQRISQKNSVTNHGIVPIHCKNCFFKRHVILLEYVRNNIFSSLLHFNTTIYKYMLILTSIHAAVYLNQILTKHPVITQICIIILNCPPPSVQTIRIRLDPLCREYYRINTYWLDQWASNLALAPSFRFWGLTYVAQYQSVEYIYRWGNWPFSQLKKKSTCILIDKHSYLPKTMFFFLSFKTPFCCELDILFKRISFCFYYIFVWVIVLTSRKQVTLKAENNIIYDFCISFRFKKIINCLNFTSFKLNLCFLLKHVLK